VWLFDAFASLFTMPTDEAHMQYFRMGLALACLLKFAVWFSHGAWERLEEGAFPRYDLSRRLGVRRAAFVAAAYRPILVIRPVAAALLLIGVWPKVAALVVMAGLLFELHYEYRSNTLFLTLMTGCLLVAGDPGTGLTVTHRLSDANTWAQTLVVLITIDVYWNSAWHKLRSEHYRSGLLLAQYVVFTARAQRKMPYREFFYPRWFMRSLGTGANEAIQRWRFLAKAVIVLEIVLPLGLLTPFLWPYAVALGIVMHAAFILLVPRHLLGFTIATVSSYIAFVP
jgi:hypothetical protein